MSEGLLSLRDRLAIEADRGKVELEGSRVLIVSAFALGTLRRDLISVLGFQRAKGFLLRYGFECGYSDAMAVRQRYHDRSLRFWTEQAALLHTLEGVARVRIEKRRLDRARGQYVVHGVWENSYEAQEHLRLLGPSEDTSCWTLIGYAGGYLSAVLGKRVLHKEITCVARGDDECRFVGKTVDLWGPEADEELAFYTESKIAEELDEAHRRIQQQHQLLQQITYMHDQLTNFVLQGHGLQPLVEAVGKMLGTPVAVEDKFLRPLAHWGPPDSPDLPSVFLGSVAARDGSWMERLRSLTLQKRAVELSPEAHPLLTPRYVAPISVGSELMGYVSLLRQPNDNPDLLLMFVERAAVAIGLELLKQRIVIETESRLKGELLEDVLAGSGSVETLRDRVRYMGEDFDRPHRFILVRIDSPSDEPVGSEAVIARRETLYNELRGELTRRGLKVHIVNRRNELLLLYPTGPGGQTTDPLVRLIQEQASKGLRGLSLSICVSRESGSLNELRHVFQECQGILDLHRKFGRRGQVIQVDDLGAYELLCAGAHQDALRSYARRTLQPLLQYDEEYDAQLVPTLYWYLTLEGNLKKTAEAMNLSISGLKYRLQRLQEIAQFDLEDPEKRFDLQVALRVALLAPPEPAEPGT